VFCSGSNAAFKRVEPVLKVFTDNVPYVGAHGNGTKMKFAANHLVAIYNVACAESVTLARKMGLDPQDVLNLFGNSPVIGTGVMRLRMPFMIRSEYSPPTMKVEVWQKDMRSSATWPSLSIARRPCSVPACRLKIRDCL
jgi:3-hydroxyisobutyrate dehydrogenase-like beta-hydroxyacid dehydrogenase